MFTFLLIVQAFIAAGLVGVILLQMSEGGGLTSSGSPSGLMSARSAADFLTRTTAILAALFFATSLGLGLLTRYESRPTDILNRIPATQGQGNGILDTLGPSTTPSTPAPAENGVPTNNGAAAPAQTTPAPAASGTAAPAPAQPADPNAVPTGQ